MISLDKRYTTRKGDRVRIYCLDGSGTYPVHGAIWVDMQWIPMRWNHEGEVDSYYSLDNDGLDLREEKPFFAKQRVEIIMSTYPAPLPKDVTRRFTGKRIKLTIEELEKKK